MHPLFLLSGNMSAQSHYRQTAIGWQDCGENTLQGLTGSTTGISHAENRVMGFPITISFYFSNNAFLTFMDLSAVIRIRYSPDGRPFARHTLVWKPLLISASTMRATSWPLSLNISTRTFEVRGNW